MTTMQRHPYDNGFFHDNVYGHALELLKQHAVQDSTARIHLDVGCGFGRIAEPLHAALGRTYVGVDRDQVGLASLTERGFEVHTVSLQDEATTLASLRVIVGDRLVASITLLDTLEHLPQGDDTLRALRQLATEHNAVVVISVPNVAHRDVGFKLAFGQWEYTEAGLLDRTHVRLFGPDGIAETLRQAGLHPIAANDVLRASSDQCFPSSHPALAEATLLNKFLRQTGRDTTSSATVNQFVRLCLPGPQLTIEKWRAQTEPRPFLSIVTRTQGKRQQTLQEFFCALAGQTSTDFELLLVGHRLTLERQLMVERLVEDNPAWLNERTRIIKVDDGNRTRPLNVGFAAARGHYIAAFDDDDLPFANWVEVFETLAEQSHGCLLRAVSVRQAASLVTIGGRNGVRATGSLEKIFPPKFEVMEHLRMNRTPLISVAFPAGVFHDLHMRFDETLTTTEDWDFIMRVAPVVGVASSPKITSIYRWWETEASSRSDHGTDEWWRNHQRIYQKMDADLVLLPAGTTAQIRGLMDEYDRVAAALASADAPSVSTVDDHVTRRLQRRFGELVNAAQYDEARALLRAGELDQLPWLDQPQTGKLSNEQRDLLFHLAILDLQPGGNTASALRLFTRLSTELRPNDTLFWPVWSGQIDAQTHLGDHDAAERLATEALRMAERNGTAVPRDFAEARRRRIWGRFVDLVNAAKYDDARELAGSYDFAEPSANVLDPAERNLLFALAVLDMQGEQDLARAQQRFARVRKGSPVEDLYWAALRGEMIAVAATAGDDAAMALARTAIDAVAGANVPADISHRVAPLPPTV